MPERVNYLLEQARFDITRLRGPELLRDEEGGLWQRWPIEKPNGYVMPLGEYGEKLVSFGHASTERGIVGILAEGRIRAGVSTQKYGAYVNGISYHAAWGGWQSAWNRQEAARCLSQIKKSCKHASGIVLELLVLGTSKRCQSSELADIVKPRTYASFPSSHRGIKSFWALHESDAVAHNFASLMVDMSWPWQ
jgi:hypothetical protein